MAACKSKDFLRLSIWPEYKYRKINYFQLLLGWKSCSHLLPGIWDSQGQVHTEMAGRQEHSNWFRLRKHQSVSCLQSQQALLRASSPCQFRWPSSPVHQPCFGKICLFNFFFISLSYSLRFTKFIGSPEIKQWKLWLLSWHGLSGICLFTLKCNKNLKFFFF